jgi:diguanylate cyclase
MAASPHSSGNASARETPQGNEDLRQRIAQLEAELAALRHHAYHDPLTGLPNRALLADRAIQAMLQATRRHKTIGLLLLDVDQFKSINDQLGHSAGDLLLQQLATRLLECIRGYDSACRYGGDEFIVMLPEIDLASHAQQMQAVVQKIRIHLSTPYLLGGWHVSIGVSIGAAVLQDGHANFNELIKAADAAMYRAKPRYARRLRSMLPALASERAVPEPT